MDVASDITRRYDLMAIPWFLALTVCSPPLPQPSLSFGYRDCFSVASPGTGLYSLAVLMLRYCSVSASMKGNNYPSLWIHRHIFRVQLVAVLVYSSDGGGLFSKIHD